ncbi:PRC-barrel domain-containing protein [Dongia deserti]|uniref:PRC-barrel domain-containing protein n=1 Tax=Dongia deserti TaxID=2268030 RepID=UPI000E65A011|nr:PRC-barrel domain-containing protein [Dongia deserti]
MLKKFFLLSTVASLAAFPALAQEATQPTTITPPAEQTTPAQPADQAPAGDMTQQQPTTDPAAPTTAETEQAASPPPSEAVIPAQAADQVRAEKLIGMEVYDTNGDKVGTVKDILFDKDGKATGMVLSVGGVLGVGAKQVGLQWSEVDIQSDAEVAKIQYNQDQLKAAPDFKTQEAQKAEADAAQMQTQQENAPAPTQ